MGANGEERKKMFFYRLPLASCLLYSLQFAANCVLHTGSSFKTSRVTCKVIVGIFCWFVASFAASSTRGEAENKEVLSHIIGQNISFQYVVISVCFAVWLNTFMNCKNYIL